MFVIYKTLPSPFTEPVEVIGATDITGAIVSDPFDKLWDRVGFINPK